MNHIMFLPVLPVVFLVLSSTPGAPCHQLNFISLSVRIIIGTSYAPAVEVGLQRFSQEYPDLFANYTYTRLYIRETNNTPCGVGGQQAIIEHLTRLYSLGQLHKPNTILLAPCMYICHNVNGSISSIIDATARGHNLHPNIYTWS